MSLLKKKPIPKLPPQPRQPMPLVPAKKLETEKVLVRTKEWPYCKVSDGSVEEIDTLFQGKFRSLWQLYKDGVSSSFLNSFLTCLEQTRLSYVEGWTPRQTPMSFMFGTTNHWILEQAYQQETLAAVAGVIDSDFLDSWVKGMTAKYETKWKAENPSPITKETQQLELCLGLTEAVLPGYFRRWDGDFNGGHYAIANNTTQVAEWVSLEEIFKVPYTYPDGKVVSLRGRRDAVFRDKRKKLWVFDTKCRSVINHEDALDTLPVDIQQMLYLYATYLEFGEMPCGTIMNIIRRPGHRQGKTEPLKDFLDRVVGEVQAPKNYDHNFTRYEMGVTAGEVLAWKTKTLDPLMQAVRMWWEGGIPHYMNPNALITKYGHCGMFYPITKDDYRYVFKRKTAFNEL